MEIFIKDYILPQNMSQLVTIMTLEDVFSKAIEEGKIEDVLLVTEFSEQESKFLLNRSFKDVIVSALDNLSVPRTVLRKSIDEKIQEMLYSDTFLQTFTYAFLYTTKRKIIDYHLEPPAPKWSKFCLEQDISSYPKVLGKLIELEQEFLNRISQQGGYSLSLMPIVSISCYREPPNYQRPILSPYTMRHFATTVEPIKSFIVDKKIRKKTVKKLEMHLGIRWVV